MDVVLMRRRLRRPQRSGGLAALRFAAIALVGLLLGTVGMVVLGVGGAYSLYASYVQDLPSADEIGQLSTEQFATTRLYDRTGQVVLYEIIPPEGHRTAVPLEQIPEYLRNGTVAMEDKNFYTNPGIDLFGIGRAFLSNLRGESVQGGRSGVEAGCESAPPGIEQRVDGVGGAAADGRADLLYRGALAFAQQLVGGAVDVGRVHGARGDAAEVSSRRRRFRWESRGGRYRSRAGCLGEGSDHSWWEYHRR